MEMTPKRVLHVLGKTDIGGIESRVMDMYRNMDRSTVQFDFMVHSTEKAFFDDEIEKLGGHIYRVPRFLVYNFFSYRKAWKKFFDEHKEFAAVHGNMTSTASIYLPIAKKSGVPITIAHARSAGVDKGFKGILTKILRKSLYKKCDYCLACSALAGKAVFGEKAFESGIVKVLPDTVAGARYRYNADMREKMREELQLGERVVLGHVGRFHYAKNHEYLLQIFKEFKELEPRSILLLVGGGDLMYKMKSLAVELGVAEDVIFAGTQSNIEDYYQVMDYFVFPSRYEGLPGTIIEAQISGLKCLMSDTITDEVKITELVETASIQDDAAIWATRIYEGINYERIDRYQDVQNAGFDIMSQIHILEKGYLGEGF